MDHTLRDVNEVTCRRLNHLRAPGTEFHTDRAGDDVDVGVVIPVMVPTRRPTGGGSHQPSPYVVIGERLLSHHPRRGIGGCHLSLLGADNGDIGHVGTSKVEATVPGCVSRGLGFAPVWERPQSYGHAMGHWAIYGGYGYSGQLAARRATDLGHRPTLLGRDEAKLAAVATDLDLPHRTLSLAEPGPLREALGDLDALLNCAGPFQDTAAPIVDACLATGTHYLDITGELQVIEATAARADEAETEGVVLMPAIGFDVVPSDCLAVHLVRRFESATKLIIAFDANTTPSHGTATTALRSSSDAVVRKAGRLEPVPVASKQLIVDFGFARGQATVSLIRWGDLSMAYRSTGITNIETYSALAPDALRALKAGRYLGFLTRIPFLAGAVVNRLTRGVAGPPASKREGRSSWVYAEVSNELGGRAAARLQIPHPYTVTAWTSVEAADRVADGEVEPGFQTPGMAFGPDFILGFDGVDRQDIR